MSTTRDRVEDGLNKIFRIILLLKDLDTGRRMATTKVGCVGDGECNAAIWGSVSSLVVRLGQRFRSSALTAFVDLKYQVSGLQKALCRLS